MSVEPILKENKDRFVLFPIKHDKVWEMYKQHEGEFLDSRRNRPQSRPHRLGELIKRRKTLYQTRLGIFCSKRWDSK